MNLWAQTSIKFRLHVFFLYFTVWKETAAKYSISIYSSKPFPGRCNIEPYFESKESVLQNKTCFQIFVMSSIQVSHAVGRHLFLLCLLLTHAHPPNVFTEPSFIQLLTFLLLHNTPLNSMVRFLSRLMY